MPFDDTALHLVIALLLGAAIGAERQYRQRSAGLRTNALVALGAAAFAAIGFTMPGEASPSRMAAQVVSGIGFLGAGAIMREGLNVKGLNTAATLWCSAAVGVACGAGLVAHAMLAAGLIVVVNIVIRPLTSLIDRTPRAGSEVPHRFRITATGAAEGEAALRLLLLKQIAAGGARLQRLESEDLPGIDGSAPRVVLTAYLSAQGDATEALEAIVGRLSLEPTITRVGWEEQEPQEE
ncbi:MgtC/SapB family protein [Neoroseomonas oryzicola]|uniref:Protein MgtC n=1 Tax=Neoroseomonas oryzicola TaxID=535904 RepID=A0A9X9WD44_9PROT|nr:MgtC/SapB family protein [Neoroseomonas oryzicola]MBR0658254.1 MgtC/SapB family protein [Neoroseomonas oryzicola]NKE15929.1 MgtC/SapB family protein [Neoroseomonas oryzicola]